MTKFIIKSASPDETQEIGFCIGQNVQSGDVILLSGELGSGKTCLTQGIARGLGVEGYVRSPTFVLVSEHQGRIPLYHMDIYRLNDISEVLGIGLDEYMEGSGVSVIEWADKAIEAFPSDCLAIKFTYSVGNERTLDLNFKGNHYDSMIDIIRSRFPQC
ncbi:tRNA (adenosine(37)-N6)-threonylcarbamoyltransferase complex ATPase subunit type 1 TsaE [Dehalococcoidia bacterium]|nr:tRNA (adenosine(37)-N6)-threonylcarbamoyltransferase complex ATPase subunit type 1 TsaE [Dehalococcoidia bacterium]